jgi:hypothetical protein
MIKAAEEAERLGGDMAFRKAKDRLNKRDERMQIVTF